MGKFSFERILNIIDRIEFEEIRALCDKKKCCDCKIKKPDNECSYKNKKEVR